MKTCIRCHRDQPAESFHTNASFADGRDSTCRDCRNATRRARAAERAALRPPPPTLAAYFAAHVPAGGGCRPWQGSRDSSGYGRAFFRGTVRKAHRLAWELHRGRIPAGASVLHRCDHPPCCNPDHLFLGTQADNLDDMRRKGRAVHVRGEAHGVARLTAESVAAIRGAAAKGASTRSLARRYGVSLPTITAIVRRETWAHVADSTPTGAAQ